MTPDEEAYIRARFTGEESKEGEKGESEEVDP
jgi:hypothetical protein